MKKIDINDLINSSTYHSIATIVSRSAIGMYNEICTRLFVFYVFMVGFLVLIRLWYTKIYEPILHISFISNYYVGDGEITLKIEWSCGLVPHHKWLQQFAKCANFVVVVVVVGGGGGGGGCGCGWGVWGWEGVGVGWDDEWLWLCVCVGGWVLVVGLYLRTDT